MSRIKESKENLQNRGEEEEEKIFICNINFVSSYKGKIEAYVWAYNHKLTMETNLQTEES